MNVCKHVVMTMTHPHLDLCHWHWLIKDSEHLVSILLVELYIIHGENNNAGDGGDVLPILGRSGQNRLSQIVLFL